MNFGLNIRGLLALSLATILFAPQHEGWCQAASPEPQVAVTLARVEKTTLRAYVTAYGTIETEPPWQSTPAAGARVASPISGIVSEVPCYEGLQVEKGTVICKLDSRMAQAEVEKAEHLISLVEKTYKRQKELQATSATSEKNFQEAETQLANARSDLAMARIALSLHRITAPISGTITRLDVRPGEYVDSSTVVAEIADFTRLAAALKIPAAESAVLKIGQMAQIKTENDAAPIICKLTVISPQVDAASGTVTAYAALPRDTLIQPGRFVSARIVCGEHRNCLAVPETSVVKDPDTGWIIAVVKDDHAVHMNVKTGFRDNGLVEVRAEGLSEGMMVVKVGAYGLPDETRIRVVENTPSEAEE